MLPMTETDKLLRFVILLPAIIALVILGVGGMLGIEYLRPGNKDNVLLVSQIFALVSPTLMALLVLLKVEGYHRQINSRMDELLKRTGEEGYARGLAEGKLSRGE